MAFGVPLQESTVDNFPPDCVPNLRRYTVICFYFNFCCVLFLGAVLSSILSPESLKNGLPTLDNLLQRPFFTSIILSLESNDKAHLKIPTSTKEQLKIAKHHLEERLREEQKMVRSQKRLVRVQEMMSSEEEKKKQRHKKVFYNVII